MSSSPSADLFGVARAFSPRVERREDAVLLDVSGLGRIVGDPPAVGRELAREACARGIDAAVAIAATRTAATLSAWCLVPGAGCGRVPGAWQVPGAWPVPGAGRVIVIPPGEERQAVGKLPIAILSAIGLAEHLPTLGRWGLRTLGEVAALTPADLHARLGAAGLALHRIACGRDDGPLVPRVDAARFEASMDLEWPIDALEPLSFVLARLLEPLSAALERADRGASAIALTLTLVTREAVTRRLELPAPMRDARMFRTLLLLQLESQPVADAIDRVAVLLEPTPARIVQYSLLERAVPSPETLSTLVARLEALMGTGRVGAPTLVDSHEPGAFAVRPFACGVGPAFRPGVRGLPEGPDDAGTPDLKVGPTSVLRRFRLPVPARVDLDHGRPMRVTTGRRGLAGGRVIECAGPWRASGGWWAPRIATDQNQPRITTDKHGSGSRCDVKTDAAASAASEASGGGPWGWGPGASRIGDGCSSDRKIVANQRAERQRGVVGAGGGAPAQSKRWNKDEWDVALPDGVYRIYRDRDSNRWFLDGMLD